MSGAGHLLRKSAFAAGLGVAQQLGYLARVPTFLSLSAEGSLAVLTYAARRYLGGPAWLMDVSEVAAVVAANHFGRTALNLGTPGSGTAGVGADPYAVEGEEYES